MADEESTETQSAVLSFQAELSPAEASDVREALLAGLATARDAKKSVSVDVQGEPATPCAIQLLVATTRSAAAAGVDLSLSERAGNILAGIHAD